MKIGIHHRPGSFSDHWIKYCQDHDIEYKIVNVYDNDIINQLEDCDAFMWHHHHAIYRDTILAKHLLATLQLSGKVVFPDFSTGYSFDDKIAQKYIFEVFKFPAIPTYIFYDKDEALEWTEKAIFPKVFKLKGGAGASNVRLVKSKREAKRLIKQAFSRGIKTRSIKNRINEQYRHFKRKHITLVQLIKAIVSNFLPNEFSKLHGFEKGYVYFQDFISNNSYDIRIIVIGDKAFGLRRDCREDDFRASGSGCIQYIDLPESMLKIAFEVSRKLKSQVIALDFILDNNIPQIIEMSFGFTANAYSKCKGYYTEDMQFHPGNYNQVDWIIEKVISDIHSTK